MEINARTRFEELFVWFLADPANPQYIGRATRAAQNESVALEYGDSWLANGFALSDDLPLKAGLQISREKKRAIGALDDARPDRWGEKVIRCIVRPTRVSLMELLYYAGDDRFGALGISSSQSQYLPYNTPPLPSLGAAQQLSDIAAKIESKEDLTDPEAKLMAGGGSIGGAKPKALIEIDGEQWVLKFFNGEPVDIPLVEYASMTLCQQANITVAKTKLILVTVGHALAVKRFDRESNNGVNRIHCISAGTALKAVALDESEVELGYPALAQLLRRFGPTENNQNKKEMAELFRRMVFNILMDNTDDHEKNHSLLLSPYPGTPLISKKRTITLSPAYDVLPTNSGQGAQQFIVGNLGTESSLENAMTQHEQFGLTEEAALAEILAVIAVVDTWKEHFAKCGVLSSDISALANIIDDPVLADQREAFKLRTATSFTPSAKKRRRSPFAP